MTLVTVPPRQQQRVTVDDVHHATLKRWRVNVAHVCSSLTSTNAQHGTVSTREETTDCAG